MNNSTTLGLANPSEDLTRQECKDFYGLVCIYMYGREFSEEDFKKFWRDMRLEKKLEENDGKMLRDDILNAAGDDWQLSKV